MAARSRALFYLALVFLCGLVGGAMTMNLVEHRIIHRPRGPAPAGMTFEARDHMLENVKDELALTPEQTRQLERIVDDAMQQFQQLHSEAHRVREDAKARIRAMLDDQQKQKFEQSIARLQQHLNF